ncbi:hypothetical protein SEA_RUBYRALPH_52 [Microbacterium phage RubyRalph]|nr:hypothetical protein SEA_RUBYRALPH_52 [Microbacterium phage RubyRalph]
MMGRHRAPWLLRWAFIWAIVVGDTTQISYLDGLYRIEVRSARVRRWQRRNDRKRVKEIERQKREALR